MDQPPILPIQPNSPEPEPEPEPPSGDPTLRQWIVGLHLSPLAGVVLPFGNIFAPLIIWLLKKSEFPALEPVGKTVLNYQLSWSIWMVAATVVAIVGSCLVVPIVIPFGFLIAWLIFTIVGSVKASNGEAYTYPLTIPFLK